MKRSKIEANIAFVNQASDKTLSTRFMSAVSRNPMLLSILWRLLAALAEWALENLIDKEGKPRTPRWMKVLGILGIGPVKKLRKICDDACAFVEQLNP